MTTPLPPNRSVPAWRLAKMLVALRKAAGLERVDVERELAVGHSTVFRAESARVVPHDSSLIKYLDLYEASDADRAEVLELARTAREYNDGGWLRAVRGRLPDVLAEYLILERDAKSLSEFASSLVPGLFQTAAYAHAAVRGILHEASDSEVEVRVAVRMDRKTLLTGPSSLRLDAVIDEAALRRVVGSHAIMAEQLRVLRELPAGVDLRVLPYEAGAHPGMPGAFVIMQIPEAGSLVYIDSMAGDSFRNAPLDLDRYGAIFARLAELALSPEESSVLIGKIEEYHMERSSSDGS